MEYAINCSMNVPNRTEEEQDSSDFCMWTRSEVVKALRYALKKDPGCGRCVRACVRCVGVVVCVCVSALCLWSVYGL